MPKLKLESLKVESFDTTAAAPSARGTVQGHDAPFSPGGESVCICQFSKDFRCQTYDYQVCPDTAYLDCTLVCSDFASCQADTC
jgi:hypothetical protein